uniref:Glycosyltransferase RgtA/B/C/D-like domain-containing protein n=1 Tax=Eiseniibacteriota bacterium TaxID=2212470 RepID=A0A832I0E4_UNCEI
MHAPAAAAPGPSGARAGRAGFVVAAAAVLVAAAAIRLAAARSGPLWFDEIYTLWVARRAPAELLATVAGDIHPPLHYLLVAAWRALGGESDLWIKSLSVAFGVATVGVTAALGRALFGPAPALYAAALLAVHRVHVGFSQESRSYALLYLLLAAAAWAAWRWLAEARPRHAALYVLCGAAALWTHYLAGAVLAALAVWGLVAPGAPARRARWLGLHVAIAALFAPQAPTLLDQMRRVQADRWVPPAGFVNLADVARQLAFGATYLIAPLGALALAPLVAPQRRRAATLLWVTGLLPVLVLWVLAQRGAGMFVERYMYFGLPAWCLLVAAGLDGRAWRPARLAAAALLLALAVRSLLLWGGQPEAKRLAQAARHMRDLVAAGETVVHADAHSFAFFRHYAPDAGRHLLLMTGAPLAYYEGDLVIPSADRVDSAAWRAAIAGGGRWWGFYSRYAYAPAARAAAAIEAAADTAVLRTDRIVVWRGGSITPPAP